MYNNIVLNFKHWLNELVYTGEPAAQDMEDMIRKSGGGAMLTGTVEDKPWTSIVRPSIPDPTRNTWHAGRQIARRLRPITPTGKFMMKRKGPS